MKKSVFISVLVVLFSVFSFFKTNVACAQTIKCEVRNGELVGKIFLFQYDNEGNNDGYIWVYEFINRLLSDDDRRFLEQVNGQEIHEGDVRYNQLLEISTTLFEGLDYNPLARYMSPEIIALHSDVFNILQGLINAQ